MNQTRKSAITIVIAIVLGIGIAAAGSAGSASSVGALPLFAVGIALAFVINWAVFIPSNLAHTEKFFDLTGSLTYITVIIASLALASERDARSFIVAALVVIWAARLGAFLFRRIRADGKDGRFDAIKTHPVRFLSVWTIQGLWVSLTLAAALAATTSPTTTSLDVWAIIGIIVWGIGFAIEVIADAQKSRWRADPANAGRFITTGLWSRSRHPNYVGEITLWIGMALIAVPTLDGWRYLTLISPAFVALLLIKVSGIPMLEARADARWGGQDDYEDYKRTTPVLIPKLF
ncbi:MAG: hypothetical protein CSA55_05935 [Ilumatobacter coccineus]|uniref:Uncharacterized protein n=1 Tax=Ilumatobacter coccineus TaxID=467094 RepID=A0A2G6K6W6_9ACTN|nr:MAG: hypothetical protein CSA55_05935 [Ilumatobacter coccineus]